MEIVVVSVSFVVFVTVFDLVVVFVVRVVLVAFLSVDRLAQPASVMRKRRADDGVSYVVSRAI
ncbi:hypothetical protein [Haladaptatus litoreus]|uniref:hypothetical protein n=1 Tax=Haladaptatus litoreus TaxID=553468 RepID=UPI0009711D16|nr:hypothetical protein [Haladaptatus litoreus]